MLKVLLTGAITLIMGIITAMAIGNNIDDDYTVGLFILTCVSFIFCMLSILFI